MKPIQTLSESAAAEVQIVCTDIDDTLTEGGKLGPEAYSALWELKEAGLKVIPVTGRPAGWCDMIARQWPVSAVIGENGAFAFYLENDKMRRIYHPSVAHKDIKLKLTAMADAVCKAVPRCRIAGDQFCRLFDVAIDFREEPPDLGFDVAEQIAAFCRSKGAQARISSIHVNAWFGDYSKLDMVLLLVSQLNHINLQEYRDKLLFVGDSPNDEPLFSYFPLTCGVANINNMLHLIHHKPAYITRASHGQGFAEMARMLLKQRKDL